MISDGATEFEALVMSHRASQMCQHNRLGDDVVVNLEVSREQIGETDAEQRKRGSTLIQQSHTGRSDHMHARSLQQA